MQNPKKPLRGSDSGAKGRGIEMEGALPVDEAAGALKRIEATFGPVEIVTSLPIVEEPEKKSRGNIGHGD